MQVGGFSTAAALHTYVLGWVNNMQRVKTSSRVEKAEDGDYDIDAAQMCAQHISRYRGAATGGTAEI